MRASLVALSLLVGFALTACPAKREPSRPRAYSVPIVDLSGDSSRRVVVDREPGQYLGHPTTVLLEDGRTMLVAYPRGHGQGEILLKRSEDGGRTWSERLPTPGSWATSKETPTLFRVIDPRGAKRLILFSGLYPIRMSVSEDDGGSWSELEAIGDFGGIVAMSSMLELGGGAYLAFFHDDGRYLRGLVRGRWGGAPGRFKVYRTVSDDGGLTWRQPEAIVQHPRAQLCEPGAVRSPDGQRIALLLRENSRRMNSMVVFSDDEGLSWSRPIELSGALTGDRHVARYAPDGRLFVTFRDTGLESPTWGDWVGWVGRFEDLETGGEGQYRVRIMENNKDADCCYSGLELLPGGVFVATTYGHWDQGEPPYIVSARFRLEELDRMSR